MGTVVHDSAYFLSNVLTEFDKSWYPATTFHFIFFENFFFFFFFLDKARARYISHFLYAKEKTLIR